MLWPVHPFYGAGLFGLSTSLRSPDTEPRWTSGSNAAGRRWSGIGESAEGAPDGAVLPQSLGSTTGSTGTCWGWARSATIVPLYGEIYQGADQI
jgi:hypothetical protein